MMVEKPMDFGGAPIDIQDIISDDVISKIKGLNPDLGVEGKDPLYDRYAQYRDEIENAELIIIDANSLNRSSIMNLDLSGDMSGIEELPSDYFQLRDDTLELAFGCDDFGIDDIGTNEYEGFEAFSAFGDTEYSMYSNGLYD
jgi:hypothetical protein